MGFIDYLYGTSVLNLGLVLTAIVVGGTFASLLLINRYWSRELRRDHNDIAGFLIAVVGVVFAIMVSSLAIIVLERKDHAEALVLQEAQALQSMQRETDLLAPENRKVMRAHLLGYLNAIIDGDWPSMRQARWPTASRASAAALWSDIVELPVTNYSQMLTAQNLRKQLDKLADIRLDRSTIATSGVDPVVWSVVLLGSIATILFAVIFGVRNLVAHALMTGLLSFTIALALTMLVATDWPYFGGDSVAPGRLIDLRAETQTSVGQ